MVLEMVLKWALDKPLGLVPSVSGETFLEVIVATGPRVEPNSYCSVPQIDSWWGSRHGSGDEPRNKPSDGCGADFWNWLWVLF